jgi:hypothetical protein
MRILSILAFAVAAAASGGASAVTCYTLLDRSDNLLYQDSLPPVDMSDGGAALREGFRRRNEYLLVSEVDSCPAVAAVAGTTGYRPATVDEIVAAMRTYGIPGSGGGVSGSGRAGGGATSATSSAVSSARSGSAGTRSSY